MTGIIIVCIVLLLLALVLLTPVRVRVSCEENELNAQIRYGPVKLQVYPLKKSEKQKPDKKKKKKQDKPAKKKNRARINREQIFYSLEKLPPILGRALKRTRQRITVTPLKVDLLIAGRDPADTAVLYGRLSAALAAGLPVLQKNVRVREQEIRLYPDFVGERTEYAADVGISIRPWDVLVIAVCAGGSLLKWLLGFRKLASPPPAEDRDAEQKKDSEDKSAEKTKTAGADKAA